LFCELRTSFFVRIVGGKQRGFLDDQLVIPFSDPRGGGMGKQSYQTLERRVQELAEAEYKLRELEIRCRCLEEYLTEAYVMYDAHQAASRVNAGLEQVFESEIETTNCRGIPCLSSEEDPSMVRSHRQGAGFLAILDDMDGSRELSDADRLLLFESSINSRRTDIPLAHARVNPTTAYRKLFQKHPEGLAIIDFDGTYCQINRRLARILGVKQRDVALSRNWHEVEQLRRLFDRPVVWRLMRKGLANYETPYVKRDGTQIWLLLHGALLELAPNGNHMGVLSVANITRRKRNEDRAKRSNRLLTSYCASLELELSDRVRDVEMSRKQISEHSQNLERVRGALKTIMAQVQQQKKDLQERVHHNLGLAVYPIIDRLRGMELTPSHEHVLDVLEFNIRHITGEFGIRLLGHEARLSPREIQVCQMIRAGKDSREIATSLGLTYETVIVHRKNIRKKLGLKSKKQNLAGFIREHMS
jgi:PAS domain S-box-containing protein